MDADTLILGIIFAGERGDADRAFCLLAARLGYEITLRPALIEPGDPIRTAGAATRAAAEAIDAALDSLSDGHVSTQELDRFRLLAGPVLQEFAKLDAGLESVKRSA